MKGEDAPTKSQTRLNSSSARKCPEFYETRIFTIFSAA
jgi:hypothetical protein